MLPNFKSILAFTMFFGAVVAMADEVPPMGLQPMTYYEAETYCATNGMRLPTARDLVQYSIGLGAKGIIEVADYHNEPGYYLISTKELDGSLDQFYFNRFGYKKPDSESPRNWIWSSSGDPANIVLPYVLNADNGAVFTKFSIRRDSPYDHFPVKCYPLLR